jgi:LacI family transcriptional regulator
MFGRLSDGRIDGLILHTRPSDPLVDMLRQSSLPVVAVADPLPGLPAVTSDDASGMQLLVRSLWERGYRRFVFLAPHLRLSSVERRREAFEHAMTQCGLNASAWCVIGIDFEKAAPLLPILGQLSTASAEPLAVCCWNDRTAYDLLQACAENDVAVPGQFAITGFDGFRDEKMPARELVTVQCRWDDVSRAALALLVTTIKARQLPNRPSQTMLAREISLPVVLLDGDTA